MARNKKVEILSNGQEVLHPITDGDCVIFSDGQTLTQKLSEDDSVKYTPEVTNSSPMFKVGEGNTVDYSANVLDGAYERAVLTGQTYTNNIQEPSADTVTLPTPFTTYERTQHNTLTSNEEGTLGINLVGQSYVNALQHDSEEEYVVLGEDLEFQEKKVEYTKEGNIKSAMLKGQTLVNLQKINGVEDVSTQSYKDTWQTVITKQQSYNMWRTGDVSLFKPNTKYLCIMEVKENTFTLPASLIIGHDECIFEYNETMFPTHKTEFQPKETGRKITILTTKANFNGATCSQRFATNIDNVTQGEKISFRIMLLEYQDGMENWDIPYFEGMQSVTVSTKLENLCHTYYDGKSTNDFKVGKTFTVKDATSRALYMGAYDTRNPMNMKPNTKYLIQFQVSNLVLDGASYLSLTFSDSTLSSGNCMFGQGFSIQVSQNGIYRYVATTTDIVDTSSIVIKGGLTEWEQSSSTSRKMTISNIMYIEYQNGMENWDLPYFEDYQVMKPVQVESVNKNLVNKNDFIENRMLSWAKGDYTPGSDIYAQTSEMYYPIKYSSTYTISGIQGTRHICFYDKDKNALGFLGNDNKINSLGSQGSGSWTQFCLSQYPNVAYCRISIRGLNETKQDLSQLQFEESDIATSYVPHQSKTTYSWDEVILRKIGDVEDTLDLTTGEWVQRIGEIVLDGSDDEIWYPSGLNQNLIDAGHKNIVFYYNQQNNGTIPNLKIMPYDSMGNIICDKLQSVIHKDQLDANSKDCSSICGGATATEIRIAIPVENSTAQQDSATCKAWLKANPIRVQYELATPKIHKVNLSRPNLQVYDDITHVHTKCLDGTLIPNIYLPAEVSYPVGVESETVYNVCVNHEVSSSSPLVCNVGGSTFTVTQPRTLITVPQGTKTISFSGKDNVISEVMMIKNSSLLTRDLPHFNGIGSVQLGKTIENLCESKVSPVGNSELSSYTEYLDYFEFTISKTGSRVITSKLLKPLENGKKYFVYAPNNYPSTALPQVSFSKTHNGSISFTQEVTQMIDKKYAIVSIQNQEDKLYDKIVVGFHGPIPTGTYTIQKPIICEYEPGMEDWDWESIGYFTGTKNIGNEFMKVQNKNLFVKYYDKININNIKNLSIRTDNTVGATRMALRFYDKNLQPILNSNAISCNKQFYHVDNNNKWVLSSDRTQVLINNISILDNNIAFMTIEKFNSNIEYINVQIEESSSATTYTAHKHNGLYVRKDQPIELTWEQGNLNCEEGQLYTDGIGNSISYRIRTKLTTLKPNTTYHIKQGNPNYQWYIYVFNQSDIRSAATSLGTPNSWANGDFKFTTTKELHKVCIVGRKIDDSALTPTTINGIVLEEVEEIKLRGIDGICDELDITRGKYIQRIDEIVYDGSQDERWHVKTVSAGSAFCVDWYGNKIYHNNPNASSAVATYINNRYVNLNVYVQNGNGIVLHSYSSGNGVVYLRTDDGDVASLRESLQSKPIILQYRLAEPIEHDIVFIGNKNESGAEITKPNGIFTLPTLYTEQTHIELQNNGLMPKVESRDYIEYPIISGMHRTYTLQHNSIGSSDLTIDVCGRTQTIPYSSPKSLVYSDNENYVYGRLRISGAGNKISKVMLLDGGHMDRDIPYIEGMKNAVNPIVKNVGKNLFDKTSTKYIGSWLSSSCAINKLDRIKLYYIPCLPNTTYTISKVLSKYFRAGTTNEIPTTNSTLLQVVIKDSSSEMLQITTVGGAKYLCFNVYDNSQDTLTEQQILDTVMLTQGVQNIQYEPYKENICYVDCGEIRLTPDMFEQGNIVYNGANTGATYDSMKEASHIRIRVKELIKIKPNTKYLLNVKGGYGVFVREFDVNKGKLNDSALSLIEFQSRGVFTTNANTQYISLLIGNLSDTSLPLSDFDKFNLLLIENNDMVILRSLPNGVHDEIDLETGKYIQRIGEITFNGSESWIQGYQSWENKDTFYTNGITYSDGNIKVRKGENGSGQAYDDSVRCGELQRTYMQRIANNETYGVCSYFYSGYQRIFVRVPNITTADELKLWLSQNPITVQYELETPIVKDIVIHNYPHSYKGGHVLIENGDPNTPIPAQITYRAVTNRSGQIQQHTEQVEKQEREINELEMLILANISNQTR